MLGYIFLILLVCFLYKSFYKACVFIMTWSLVFMHVIVGKDFTLWNMSSLAAFIFFIHKLYVKDIRIGNFPFVKSYILLILSFVLPGFSLKLGVLGGIVGMFLFPFVAWIAKDKIKNYWNFIFVNLTIFSIVIVSVGLLELALGFNPVSLYLESNNIMQFTEVREDYLRFGLYRCRSLTAWCSTYGVVCGFMMITLLFCMYYRRIKIPIFSYILCALLFVGVLSTGTRSVYTAVVIGLIPLIMNYATKLKYVILLFIIALFVYENNQELFNEIADSFIHSDEAGGSDVDMRMSQYQAAYKYFEKSPLFGNGIGAVGEAMQKTSQLLGAESCIYIIMIDRGLFGFIAYGLFNIQIVLYLFKKRKYRALIFIPIAILTGKIISAFIDINEVYPIFWLSILTKAIDDCLFEYKGKRISINKLGLIKL